MHELRQEGLDARAKVNCLVLCELVEEASGSDQAILILGPVEIVVYNEISDWVSILVHQLVKDVKEARLAAAVLTVGKY